MNSASGSLLSIVLLGMGWKGPWRKERMTMTYVVGLNIEISWEGIPPTVLAPERQREAAPADLLKLR